MRKRPPKKTKFHSTGGGGGYRDRLTTQVQKCAWGELGGDENKTTVDNSNNNKGYRDKFRIQW